MGYGQKCRELRKECLFAGVLAELVIPYGSLGWTEMDNPSLGRDIYSP